MQSPLADRDEVGRADLGGCGWRAWVLMGVPAAMHPAIGLSFAGRRSLQCDETFGAETARLPLGDLLRMLTNSNINMSACQLVLTMWSAGFGQDDVARARSPS